MEVDDAIKQLQLRCLDQDLAEEACVLSTEARWNQTAADWELMLEHGEGFGLFTDEDELVATALILPYGDNFAWISMVLVKSTWRRKGLATYLMRKCTDRLDQLELPSILDATRMGRHVYTSMDFHDICIIRRLVGESKSIVASSNGAPDGITIQSMCESDLEEVANWDAERFESDRGFLLKSIAERSPELAYVARKPDGKLAGYVLGRDGRAATQIGPLAALDESIADALLVRAASEVDGSVYVDAPDSHAGFIRRRFDAGWVEERSFIRMANGNEITVSSLDEIFAIAGPDFG